jgi:hypothetical protein
VPHRPCAAGRALPPDLRHGALQRHGLHTVLGSSPELSHQRGRQLTESGRENLERKLGHAIDFAQRPAVSLAQRPALSLAQCLAASLNPGEELINA